MFWENNITTDKVVITVICIESTGLQLGDSAFRPPFAGVSRNLARVHLSSWNVVFPLPFLGTKIQIQVNKLNRNASMRYHFVLLKETFLLVKTSKTIFAQQFLEKSLTFYINIIYYIKG